MDYKLFVYNTIENINNLSEKKFLDSIKNVVYKEHFVKELKPRKRRLRKKFKTHEFKKSSVIVEIQ